MRAFAVQSFGEAPAIHDLPVPSREGAFLIRVSYAGVNPLDSRLLERLTADSTYPFVMGIDFAGVVEHVPAGESDLKAGERIFGMAHTHGSYAEYTAVAPGMKADPVARIPDGVSDEQAAALPTSGVTALRSLDLLGVSAGQRLVVMGATGGVGGYAVQMALSRGAYVIATVRGDAEEARRLGAEDVYDTNTTDVIDALRKSYRTVSTRSSISSTVQTRYAATPRFSSPGARLVSTIFAADEAWFAKRNITAHNHASSNNPLLSPQGLREVARMLADGTITARIGSTFNWTVRGRFSKSFATEASTARPSSASRTSVAAAVLSGVEPDFDADGVGDAGQVAGVAGDDGGLVADGGGDDDGVHDVGGGRRRRTRRRRRGRWRWSSGTMSQPLSTREIWCWGPPRQAWASTTTGTIGRMRAAVSSSCRARKSGLRRSAASSAPVS